MPSGSSIVFLAVFLFPYVICMYPRTRLIVTNYLDFDKLHSPANGLVSENFTFLEKVHLITVVLPTQVIDCSNKKGYDENLSIALLEYTNKENFTVIGRGSFSGPVPYGSVINVDMLSIDKSHPLVEPQNPSRRYSLVIVLGSPGLYPWFMERIFSNNQIFDIKSDQPGFIVGFEYAQFRSTAAINGLQKLHALI